MDWRFCYFGGKYNEQFIDSCIADIFAVRDFAIVFADIEFLIEVEKRLPVNCERNRGKRFYHTLNVEKFLRKKLSFIELPENFELILSTEKENEKVILMYNGKEAGHCDGGIAKI